MNEAQKYINEMKQQFQEAVKKAAAEHKKDIEKAASGFSDALTDLITAQNKQEVQQAKDLMLMYESILQDYCTVETVNFSASLLKGVSIGLRTALQIATTLLNSLI